jgi:hypothetical protein
LQGIAFSPSERDGFVYSGQAVSIGPGPDRALLPVIAGTQVEMEYCTSYVVTLVLFGQERYVHSPPHHVFTTYHV